MREQIQSITRKIETAKSEIELKDYLINELEKINIKISADTARAEAEKYQKMTPGQKLQYRTEKRLAEIAEQQKKMREMREAE